MQYYWLTTICPSWKRRMSPLQPNQKGSNMLLSHPKAVILQQILQSQVHWAGLNTIPMHSMLLSLPSSPVFDQVSSNLPASLTRVPSAMLLPKPAVVLTLMLHCWRGSCWCSFCVTRYCWLEISPETAVGHPCFHSIDQSCSKSAPKLPSLCTQININIIYCFTKFQSKP